MTVFDITVILCSQMTTTAEDISPGNITYIINNQALTCIQL